MMAFIGVRISWLMLARNSDLTRVASRAASRAAISSRSLFALGDVAHDGQDLVGPEGDDARLEVAPVAPERQLGLEELRLAALQGAFQVFQAEPRHLRREELLEVAVHDPLARQLEVVVARRLVVQQLAVAADAHHEVGDGVEKRAVARLAVAQSLFDALALDDILGGEDEASDPAAGLQERSGAEQDRDALPCLGDEGGVEVVHSALEHRLLQAAVAEGAVVDGEKPGRGPVQQFDLRVAEEFDSAPVEHADAAVAPGDDQWIEHASEDAAEEFRGDRRVGEIARHAVETAAQVADLVRRNDRHSAGEIAAPDPLRGLDQQVHRPQGPAHEQEHEGHPDDGDGADDAEQLNGDSVGGGDRLAQRHPHPQRAEPRGGGAVTLPREQELFVLCHRTGVPHGQRHVHDRLPVEHDPTVHRAVRQQGLCTGGVVVTLALLHDVGVRQHFTAEIEGERVEGTAVVDGRAQGGQEQLLVAGAEPRNLRRQKSVGSRAMGGVWG